MASRPVPPVPSEPRSSAVTAGDKCPPDCDCTADCERLNKFGCDPFDNPTQEDNDPGSAFVIHNVDDTITIKVRSPGDRVSSEVEMSLEAWLKLRSVPSAGSASEPVACDTIDKIIKQADWYVSVDAHAGLAHHLAKHWPEIRSGLYATPSDRQAIEALTQAKAFILLDSLSPAEHSFEIEKRKAYRENLVAKIDRALAKEQGR
jgi:hypothetical protein